MENLDHITNPSAFIEKFVTNNANALEVLEKDKSFNEAYKVYKESQGMNQIISTQLSEMLFEDEYLPGEIERDGVSYVDNLYQLPFGPKVLRNGGRTEPARLVKNLRSMQFTEIARPSNNNKKLGWRLRFRDEEYVPSEYQKQRLKELTYLLVDKFFYPFLETKPSFPKFLLSAYGDFFDLDDRTIETRRSLIGTPLGLHMVDPTLVKPAIRHKNNFKRWDEKYNPATVANKKVVLDPAYLLMKENGRIIGAASEKFMNKFHFFVSSELRMAKRGFSIVEQGIRVLYGIISAMNYNNSNFSNNRTPMGLLAFTGGAVNPNFIEKFKKLMYAYLSGAHNRHRIPIIGLPEKGDAKFVPFNMSSREMEFHLQMAFLGSIFYELSGTNPLMFSQASHDSAMTGKKLFDQNPDGVTRTSSDTGLCSFLRTMSADMDSTGVFREITGGWDVVNEFTGLETEDERIKIQVDESALASTKSLNDAIKAEGGKQQTKIFNGENIYDIVGINNPFRMEVLKAEIEIEKLKLSSLAQGQPGGQPGGQPNGQEMPVSEKDNDMMKKYGAPEEQ